MNLKTISINLPEELLNEAHRICKENNWTFDKFIENQIALFIAAMEVSALIAGEGKNE